MTNINYFAIHITMMMNRSQNQNSNNGESQNGSIKSTIKPQYRLLSNITHDLVFILTISVEYRLTACIHLFILDKTMN